MLLSFYVPNAQLATLCARTSDAFFIFPLYVDLVLWAGSHGFFSSHPVLVQYQSSDNRHPPFNERRFPRFLHEYRYMTGGRVVLHIHVLYVRVSICTCLASSDCRADSDYGTIMYVKRRRFLSDARHLGLGHRFSGRSNEQAGNFLLQAPVFQCYVP